MEDKDYLQEQSLDSFASYTHPPSWGLWLDNFATYMYGLESKSN